ncbi:hypothetical protein AAC387_Pa03g3375 [Persea americana]
MHGRPRNPPIHEEDAAASIADAASLRTLQSQFLHAHHNRIYDKEALEISWKLLEMNPEVYSAWNYRKLAVENNLRSLSDDPDSIKALLDRELTLGFSSTDLEFRLLDQFLKVDSWNFQGWNHRRFVAGLENQSLEDELKFTTDKINSNFSNYSAWHNRSVLLSQLLKQKGQRLSEDYEPSISKWQLETLSNEIALFRELLSEINCKIAKLTLARLLMAHDAIMSYGYGTLCMHECIHSEEVLELLNDLMKLDVIHSCYYKDEVSLLLIEQV